MFCPTPDMQRVSPPVADVYPAWSEDLNLLLQPAVERPILRIAGRRRAGRCSADMAEKAHQALNAIHQPLQKEKRGCLSSHQIVDLGEFDFCDELLMDL